MNMNIFSACRERLTAREVAERYGFEFKGGRIKCPFHGGKNYNLSFHGGGFNCFVCGEKGDCIKFAMKLFDLSAFEAVKKLNQDFSLDLYLDEKPPRLSEKERRAIEANKIYSSWRRAACEVLNFIIALPLHDEEREENTVFLANLLMQGEVREKLKTFYKQDFLNDYWTGIFCIKAACHRILEIFDKGDSEWARQAIFRNHHGFIETLQIAKLQNEKTADSSGGSEKVQCIA